MRTLTVECDATANGRPCPEFLRCPALDHDDLRMMGESVGWYIAPRGVQDDAEDLCPAHRGDRTPLDSAARRIAEALTLPRETLDGLTDGTHWQA
jgi:hypothetical protein